MPSKHRRRSYSVSSQPSDTSEDRQSSTARAARPNGTRSRSRDIDNDQRHSDTRQRSSRDDSQDCERTSKSRHYNDMKSQGTKSRKVEYRDEYDKQDMSYNRRSRRDSYEITDRKRSESDNRRAHREAADTGKRVKPKKKGRHEDTKSRRTPRPTRTSRSSSRDRGSVEDEDELERRLELERRQKSRLVAEELQKINLARRKNENEAEGHRLETDHKSRKKLKQHGNDVDEVTSMRSGREKDNQKSTDTTMKGQSKNGAQFKPHCRRPSSPRLVLPTTSQDDGSPGNGPDPRDGEDRLNLKGSELNRAQSNRSAVDTRTDTLLNARESQRTERFVMEDPCFLRRAVYAAAIISTLDALFGIVCGGFLLANRQTYVATSSEKDYKDYMIYSYLTLHCLALAYSGLLFLANNKGQLDLMIVWIAVQSSTSIVFIVGTIIYLIMEIGQRNKGLEVLEGPPLLATLYFSSLFLTLVILKVLTVFIVTQRYKNLTWRPKRDPYSPEAGSHQLTQLTGMHGSQASARDDRPASWEQLPGSNADTLRRDQEDNAGEDDRRGPMRSQYSEDDSVSTSEFSYVAHSNPGNGTRQQTGSPRTVTGREQDTANSHMSPARSPTIIVYVHNPPENVKSDAAQDSAETSMRSVQEPPLTAHIIPRPVNVVGNGITPTPAPRFSTAKGRLTNERFYENNIANSGELHSTTGCVPQECYECGYVPTQEAKRPPEPRPLRDHRYDGDYVALRDLQYGPSSRGVPPELRQDPYSDLSQSPQNDTGVSEVKLRKSLPTGAVPAVGIPEEWARRHGISSFSCGGSPPDELKAIPPYRAEPEPDY